MSERGRTDDLGNLVALIDERLRRLRHTQLDGPVSAGDSAYLSRSVQRATSTDTYAGTPSGNSHFFVMSGDFDLRAGRVYRLEAVTQATIVSAGERSLLLVRDATYATDPPVAGTGVTSHTALAQYRDRWGTAGDTPEVAVIGHFEATTDEDDVEIALILETGLSSLVPASGEHSIHAEDIGRI